MNKDIDITKISIRRLLKLCIKDYDRGLADWYTPLGIRGGYITNAWTCRKLLKTSFSNRQLSRMFARARQQNKSVKFIFGYWLKEPAHQFVNTVGDFYDTRLNFIDQKIKALTEDRELLVRVQTEMLEASTTFRNEYYEKKIT